MRYTAEARYAEVASEAMPAFQLATILADDPRDADLAAHVATFRGHLGRRNAATGKRRKKDAASQD